MLTVQGVTVISFRTSGNALSHTGEILKTFHYHADTPLLSTTRLKGHNSRTSCKNKSNKNLKGNLS